MATLQLGGFILLFFIKNYVYSLIRRGCVSYMYI